MNKVLVRPCTFTAEDDSMYEYFLAISSDKLLVLSKIENGYELVEEIVEGKDNNGMLLSCSDEDSFLEAISVIKTMLLSGLNPLKHLDIDGL